MITRQKDDGPSINRARFIWRCRKDPPSGFSRGNRDILGRWKLLYSDFRSILDVRFYSRCRFIHYRQVEILNPAMALSRHDTWKRSSSFPWEDSWKFLWLEEYLVISERDSDLRGNHVRSVCGWVLSILRSPSSFSWIPSWLVTHPFGESPMQSTKRLTKTYKLIRCVRESRATVHSNGETWVKMDISARHLRIMQTWSMSEQIILDLQRSRNSCHAIFSRNGHPKL